MTPHFDSITFVTEFFCRSTAGAQNTLPKIDSNRGGQSCLVALLITREKMGESRLLQKPGDNAFRILRYPALRKWSDRSSRSGTNKIAVNHTSLSASKACKKRSECQVPACFTGVIVRPAPGGTHVGDEVPEVNSPNSCCFRFVSSFFYTPLTNP